MPEKSTAQPQSLPAPKAGKSLSWARLLDNKWRVAVGLCMVAFLLQIASLYSPSTGFSSLILIGDRTPIVSSLREVEPYVYHKSAGYDGQAYVQIALNPLLNNPELKDSIDNLPYRARRILLPWLAWLCGLGQPAWVVQAYALLNVAAWFALGWLLLRWLPPNDAENFFRWMAVMFSHGLILSVRGSLTDGPSLLLLLLGVAYLEKNRRAGALGFFAASILCRETLVLGTGAAVVDPSARRRPELLRIAVTLVLMVLPFLLWIAYVKWRTAATSDAGLGNFELPFVAYFNKCLQLAGETTLGSFRSWFYLGAVLASIAVLAQFCFFVLRWRLQDCWWRIGAAYAALMAFLGTAVWEGYPGAFPRVLLPMTLAFNLAVPRGRRWLALLILGNLSFLGGIEELTRPVSELTQWEGDHKAISSVVMTMGEGWYQTEIGSGHRWSWCTQRAELLFENKERTPLQISLAARLFPVSPSVLTLEGPSGVVWKSEQVQKSVVMQTGTLLLPPGRSWLRFSSDLPARTRTGFDKRPMSFAVRDMIVHVEPLKQ